MADLAEEDADRDGPLEEGDISSFDDGTFVFSEDAALRLLYPDCPAQAAKRAAAQLRPQHSLWHEVCPGDHWPRTRIRSIICTADRIVNPEWSERIARQRLAVQPEFLPGGHSPMLSRPAELTAMLADFTPLAR